MIEKFSDKHYCDTCCGSGVEVIDRGWFRLSETKECPDCHGDRIKQNIRCIDCLGDISVNDLFGFDEFYCMDERCPRYGLSTIVVEDLDSE